MLENIVRIAGHLGADPIQLHGESQAVTVFSVVQHTPQAVGQTPRPPAEKMKPVKILCFSRLDSQGQLLQKGDQVHITGKINPVVTDVKGEKVSSLGILVDSLQKVQGF